MSVPFTQYLRPHGRKTQITIDRPEDIEIMARAFIESGGWFEAEELTTGHVSLTAVRNDKEGEPNDIAIELVMNGPGVPSAGDRLIRKALMVSSFAEEA